MEGLGQEQGRCDRAERLPPGRGVVPPLLPFSGVDRSVRPAGGGLWCGGLITRGPHGEVARYTLHSAPSPGPGTERLLPNQVSSDLRMVW
eukprot:scaffold25021_cov61-Phaeocystis_antarctica.AAC.1